MAELSNGLLVIKEPSFALHNLSTIRSLHCPSTKEVLNWSWVSKNFDGNGWWILFEPKIRVALFKRFVLTCEHFRTLPSTNVEEIEINWETIFITKKAVHYLWDSLSNLKNLASKRPNLSSPWVSNSSYYYICNRLPFFIINMSVYEIITFEAGREKGKTKQS